MRGALPQPRGPFPRLRRTPRQVHCQTCLLEFGCLTATHRCPFCERTYEYRPARFAFAHVCPNTKARGKAACGKSFKPMEFSMSEGKRAQLQAKLEASQHCHINVTWSSQTSVS